MKRLVLFIILGVLVVGIGAGLGYRKSQQQSTINTGSEAELSDVTETEEQSAAFEFESPEVVMPPGDGGDQQASLEQQEPAEILPHLIGDASVPSVNDTGTVILPTIGSPSLYFPLTKFAQAAQHIPRRVITYIDKDPATNLNQLFLYVIKTGEKIKLTNENISLSRAYILDAPISAVIYITGGLSPSFHFLSLSDLSNRSFSFEHSHQGEYFGVSPDGAKLATFRGVFESTTLVIRDLSSSNLDVIREYTNPVAEPARGRTISSRFLIWSTGGEVLYLESAEGLIGIGWKIIEFNLASEAIRDLIVYDYEIGIESLASPLKDDKLYYVTVAISGETTLNELDVESGQITASFDGIANPLFSSDGSKIYATTRPGNDFIVYDRLTNQQRLLFSQDIFIQQHSNVEGLQLIGLGLTENDLIFMSRPSSLVSGLWFNEFYSYNIESNMFTELFSAGVLPVERRME